MGDSPQAVWDSGAHHLMLAVAALNDEEKIKSGLTQADLDSFVQNAITAMYCFEEIESNGWETEFSPSFAKAARDLAEGFRDGYTDRVTRGNDLAIATSVSFAKKHPPT
jgi:hypothetical protein